jgi:hypothetical protein
MADLVNDTAKRQLSPKNSEPSHLKGGSYDVLGGPTWDNKGGEDAYKIDAAKGMGTDTSIPRATGPEKSHLPTAQEEKDLDVKFDDEDDEVDDLDKALDTFEEVEPVDINIDVDDDDDEDEKEVKEDVEGNDETDEHPYPGLKKSDGEKLAEEDEDENPFAKKDEKDIEDDENEFPFKKKEKVDEEDSLGDPELSDSKIKAAAKDAGIPIEEEGDETDEHPYPGLKKSDGEKLAEEDEDENPFAKKGEKDKEDKVEEAVRVRIKMPSAKLFESVNMSAKTQKKVGVVFEQAIRETTKQVAAQIHSHYKKLHESRLAKRDAAMAKKMDDYLSYVVEEWMRANRPVIRQSLRTQLAEEFLNGLQGLFKEHYIDVPESKINVLQTLTAQNAKLKASLNEQHAQKLKLRRLAEQANKARIVAEFARGMSEVSAAKLHKLAEDTQYTSAKDFREKLSMLRESYFPKSKPNVKVLPEENIQDETPKSKNKGVDPDVNAIAKVLSAQADASKW